MKETFSVALSDPRRSQSRGLEFHFIRVRRNFNCKLRRYLRINVQFDLRVDMGVHGEERLSQELCGRPAGRSGPAGPRAHLRQQHQGGAAVGRGQSRRPRGAARGEPPRARRRCRGRARSPARPHDVELRKGAAAADHRVEPVGARSADEARWRAAAPPRRHPPQWPGSRVAQRSVSSAVPISQIQHAGRGRPATEEGPPLLQARGHRVVGHGRPDRLVILAGRHRSTASLPHMAPSILEPGYRSAPSASPVAPRSVAAPAHPPRSTARRSPSPARGQAPCRRPRGAMAGAGSAWTPAGWPAERDRQAVRCWPGRACGCWPVTLTSSTSTVSACGRLLGARGRHRRTVLHVHDMVDRTPRFWRRADVVLADSQAVADRLGGLASHVVHCPVEIDPPAASAPWPRDGRPVVGFVGRIEPRKGTLDLVRRQPPSGRRALLPDRDRGWGPLRVRSRLSCSREGSQRRSSTIPGRRTPPA